MKQLPIKLRRNDGQGYPAELVEEVGEQSAEFRAYTQVLPDFLRVGFRRGEDAAVGEVAARVRDACAADPGEPAPGAPSAPLSACASLVVAALAEGTDGLEVVMLERGMDSFEYELFRSLLPQYLQDQQALGKDRALENYGNIAEVSCASEQGPVPTDPDEAGI